MKNVIYRNANLGDVDKLEKLEMAVWGEEMAARSDKWISRISIFPEGTNIAVLENEIIGVSVSHIVDWHFNNGNFPTWEEITADGCITNHKENGNIMWGVNASVLPNSPRVAEDIVRKNFTSAKTRNMKFIFGCRIPTLSTRVGNNTVDQNIGVLSQIALRDPEVRFFIMKFGFKIIGFKHNYFEKDSKSLGWGVILQLY
jgi:hypothetical protein